MEAKSKTTAILLAVFLCPATWLYTYREDGAKFWAWAGIFIAAVFFGAVAPALGLITSIMGLAFWVWTIVGVAKRPMPWYAEYNDSASPGHDTRRVA